MTAILIKNQRYHKLLGTSTIISPSDWITAISTALTAFAASIAGFITWLAFRRDSKERLPIVEASFEVDGQYRTLSLIIRNRLPETIEVISAHIRKPKGALISTKLHFGSHGTLELTPPTSSRINLELEIEPFGNGSSIYGGSKRLDLYLFLPPGWQSGIVIVDLRISSKALTFRDKRMVIKRFANAPPAIKIASTANIPS